MTKKRTRSLAAVVTEQTALVIAVAMAIYGVLQYMANPAQGVVTLVLQHLWHVLVLGLFIYLVLCIVLRRSVVRPIRELYVKLYAVATGDLSPVQIDSGISEVQEIAEGVNLMLAKLKGASDGPDLSRLSETARTLRAIAKDAAGLDDEQRQRMIDAAAMLEQMAAAAAAQSLRSEERADG